MATILTKRSNTASSVPVAGDLTNSTGGAELAVNTADKRLFTKDSGGTVVELGTNPSSVTLPNGTANGVPYLNGSKVLTSGSALTFDGTNLGVSGNNAAHTTYLTLTNNSTAGYGPKLDFNIGYAGGYTSTEFQAGATGTSGGYLNIFAKADGGALRLAQYIGDTYSAWSVGGSEQMRLTSTGLGIGTSSPAYKLDVKGNSAVRASGTSANTSAVLTLIANNSGGDPYCVTSINAVSEGTTWASGLSFYTRTSGAADTEKMRLDSSGNLGLGVTPSAWGNIFKSIDISGTAVSGTSSGALVASGNAVFNGSNWFYKGNSSATRMELNAGAAGATWYTAPSGTAGNAISWTQAMTLDASGHLLVGATSSALGSSVRKEILLNGTDEAIFTASTGGTIRGFFYVAPTVLNFGSRTNIPLTFHTNDTERARIDSSGNLLIGTTSGTTRLTVSKEDSGAYVGYFENTTGSNANGVLISTPNRAGSSGLYGLTVANSGGNAFAIYTNGTYGTISDINRKKNVETARNGYLTDLCALRVVKYNWKEQEDSEPKELGFIAQEIEQVFAGLVQTDNNGQKMVKQPVFIPMLVKAIQEQQAIINQLKARLDAANL